MSKPSDTFLPLASGLLGGLIGAQFTGLVCPNWSPSRCAGSPREKDTPPYTDCDLASKATLQTPLPLSGTRYSQCQSRRTMQIGQVRGSGDQKRPGGLRARDPK